MPNGHTRPRSTRSGSARQLAPTWVLLALLLVPRPAAHAQQRPQLVEPQEPTGLVDPDDLLDPEDALQPPAETAPDDQQPPPERAEDLSLPTALESDGPAYSIGAFQLLYVRRNPGLPPLEEVMQTEVTLARVSTGYVAPREGLTLLTRRTLDQMTHRGVEHYHASAIQRIHERIRDFFVERGFLGIYVAQDPFQIDERGFDLRGEGETTLRVLITTGVVSEIRTLASGDRIPAADRINHPLHARILEHSPIRPVLLGGPEGADLLRKDLLDRYIFLLSRHPGRRVDLSLAAAEEPGTAAIDYHITENNPLTLYAQISNTGTRQTEEIRERAGFYHTQLTNQDDILSLDYSTTGFDTTQAVVGGYEARLFDNDRIRWRVQGTWSEFTATEVGFFNDTFTGDSWSAAGELAVNILQHREMFVDLILGARFEHIFVDNQAVSLRGEEDFFIANAGLRLERSTDWFDVRASAMVEASLPDVTAVDGSTLNALGRTAPERDWLVLQWDATASTYLEPLLNRRAWEDPASPESSTLAHELAVTFRGQYAFDNRLIPQAEMVAGGLYSVRGYPESAVAADTVLIGSVEYRYHLPRAFGIEPEPRQAFGRPFRFAPQYVYGRPDWDFILKGFLDYAQSINSSRLPFETDETLLGAGIGAELQLRRNVNVRVDWGFALEDVASVGTASGANRVHFVATFLF